MGDYLKREIERRIVEFQQLPYLFVGTGVSMRYAHAPSWDALLYGIWRMINPLRDVRDYEKLKQGIERDIYSKYADLTEEDKKYYINPVLASKIEEDFCSRYYSMQDFDTEIFTKEENDEILTKRYNPFKYYIARQLAQVKLDASMPDSHELRYFIQNQNKFAGVITTNYDFVLEQLFQDFSVVIGQDNLLVSNTLNIFEIFKIHGCAGSPNSIVLTENDYAVFEHKLKYLSAKLFTIFVEHPIIFIGYGMGDVNIRRLFKEIAECLTTDQLAKIKDNFIFISPAFGEKESIGKRELVFEKHSIVITEIILDDYSVLYQAFSKIQSSMPVKLARKLQNMVCNFVYSTEAQNHILFGDINSPDIDEEKAAIYFGKADTVTQMGFSYFSIDEILEDVLYNNKPYLVNRQLIDKTFKNIRSSAGTTLLPVYKYIRQLDYPIEKIPDNYNIINGYDDPDILPTTTDLKSYIKQGKIFWQISDIEETYPDHIPKQAAYIKKFAREIPVEDLEIYLKKYFYTDTYGKYRSLFRKLIALYDYKKYS